MPRYQLYMWLLMATWTLFIFAFGACVGSLINVIAYRMPKGISIVRPPSRCPSCSTRLRWNDNIPILGWLLLRGRCRYCRVKISPEYPIVEAAVASLFALFFILFFWTSRTSTFLGLDIGAIRPEWTTNPGAVAWPLFAIVLALLGSLAAMTIVDAKTFTIPLALTWFPAIFAAIVHPAHAAWVQLGTHAGRLIRAAEGHHWSIPTPGPHGWPWIGASIGGITGIGIASLLVATGALRRSFADYEAWEAAELASRSPSPPGTATNPDPPPDSTPAPPASPLAADPSPPGTPPAPDAQAELWIQYPHARREVLRELLFLAPCLALGFAGWKLATHLAGPWHLSPRGLSLIPAHDAPLWLSVLAGVLMGYLIGGGVVWAVRIFGSIAFGKEAMGMGDVHLMAAVGACLGWIDATLAFFLAAFVGVFWAIFSQLLSGKLRRQMPYGPFLAIATVLVLLTKPLFEVLLGRLTGSGWIDLP